MADNLTVNPLCTWQQGSMLDPTCKFLLLLICKEQFPKALSHPPLVPEKWTESMTCILAGSWSTLPNFKISLFTRDISPNSQGNSTLQNVHLGIRKRAAWVMRSPGTLMFGLCLTLLITWESVLFWGKRPRSLGQTVYTLLRNLKPELLLCDSKKSFFQQEGL